MKSYANLLKVLVAPIALAAMAVGWLGGSPPVLAQEKQIDILIKERGFHVQKGGLDYRTGFFTIAGHPTAIRITNVDAVAHEFVSPMFRNVEVQLVGEATTVSTKKAAGFRIDPGKTVTLHFTAPQTEDFETTYDLFWCNVHGKLHGEAMRGEILVVETRGEIT